MNLLDTASLVVTPNGYKASKLYSIIPSDGTGDMTFARTGDTATRVNSSGLIESVLANKPRLDYLGSTCPKLLLEPQRTNSALYSEQIDQYTNAGTTVVTNTGTSPRNDATADLVYPTTNDVFRGRYQYIVGDGNDLTISCFFKSANKRYALLGTFPASTYISIFDLQTATVSVQASGHTGKIESYGNGWYRCSIKVTAASYQAYPFVGVADNTVGTVTVDGTNGMLIWGLQVEKSSAYATSYIPTTTASVTRNADNCLKTGISSLIGQTEGTLFIQYNSSAINVDGRILAISNGAFNNRIVIAEDIGRIRVVIYTSNTLQVDLGYSSNLGSYTGNHKIAVSYANNYLIVYVDGVLKASVNTLTVPACNSIYIGNLEDGTNVTSINGRVSSVALWKTRLQNSELATLTSL